MTGIGSPGGRARLAARAHALMLALVCAVAPLRAQEPARRDLEVNISGYLQVDARWISSSPGQRGDDGPLLRRARLLVEASSPQGWALRLQPDFGLGRSQIQDAYLAYRTSASGSAYHARAGRFRPAFGVERTQPSSALLFPERSAINTLMPARALGAQFAMERPRLTATLGAFHSGAGRDASVDTDGDPEAGPSEGYDIVSRVLWRARIAPAMGLELHVGAMLGATDGTADEPGLARLLTVGQQPVVTFARGAVPDSVARADGRHARYALGALAFTRRAAGGAEVVMFSQRALRGGWSGTLPAAAWSVRASRVWRGARSSAYDIVADSTARRGVVELGFRLGGVLVGERAVHELAASVAGAPAVRTAGGGVAFRWLPGPRTHLALSYDYTAIRRARIGASTAAPGAFAGSTAEHALVVRLQQGF